MGSDSDDSINADSDSASIAAELRLDDSSVDHTDSDKAAKEDDAEVVSEDWDRWTVENFDCNCINTLPVICTGSYDSATHQPLFDGLRNLMIQQYRKNILLSFV
jgi:hypothetical protein